MASLKLKSQDTRGDARLELLLAESCWGTDGRSGKLIRGRLRCVGTISLFDDIEKIAESNSHVMVNGVRNRNRDAEPEDAMDQSERIKTAVFEENGAGDQSPNQRRDGEKWIWQVRYGEQSCRGNDSAASAWHQPQQA